MQVPNFIFEYADIITAIASITGALACVYLQQLVKDEEDIPGQWLQRVALSLLAIALLANGLYVYPEWALINGHRPTGILTEIAVAVNMAIMAGRGYLKAHRPH